MTRSCSAAVNATCSNHTNNKPGIW